MTTRTRAFSKGEAMQAKGLQVEEGEHLDVIGAGPLAAMRQATQRPMGKVVVLPVNLALKAADEGERWMQRALRAEGKLAELGRMLDEYRDKVRPMPTYAEIIRLLQG